MVIRYGLLASILLAYVASTAASQNDSASPESQDSSPIILDPLAEEWVKKMSAFLTAQKAFGYTCDVVIDVVEPNGEKIETIRHSQLQLLRPNHLHVVSKGENGRHMVYSYDKNKLAAVNVNEKAYSVTEVPDTFREMFDYVYNEYGYTVPTSDLLVDNPHDALLSGIDSGRVVGTATVAGEKCHHLAFRQDNVDWQIWIQAHGQPLPRKLVVVHKLLPESPKWSGTFTTWELNPDLKPEHFKFEAPAGMKQIELLPADEAAEQNAQTPKEEGTSE